jgi:hypothetical protein
MYTATADIIADEECREIMPTAAYTNPVRKIGGLDHKRILL